MAVYLSGKVNCRVINTQLVSDIAAHIASIGQMLDWHQKKLEIFKAEVL